MLIVIYLGTILISIMFLIIYGMANINIFNKKNNNLNIFIPIYNIIYSIKIIKNEIKNNKKIKIKMETKTTNNLKTNEEQKLEEISLYKEKEFLSVEEEFQFLLQSKEIEQKEITGQKQYVLTKKR